MKLALSFVGMQVSMAAIQIIVESDGFRWLGDTSTLPDHVKAARIPIFTSAIQGHLENFKQSIRTIYPDQLCFDSPQQGLYAVRDPYDAIFYGLDEGKFSEEGKQFATEAIRAMWECGAPAQCPEGFLASRILKAGLGYDLAIEAFERHYNGQGYLLGSAFGMNLGEVSQDSKIGLIKAYLETERGLESLQKDRLLFAGVMTVLDVSSPKTIELMTELIAKGARIARRSINIYAGKYLWAPVYELRFFETFFSLVPRELLGTAADEVENAFNEYVEFNPEDSAAKMQKVEARKAALLKIIQDRLN